MDWLVDLPSKYFCVPDGVLCATEWEDGDSEEGRSRLAISLEAFLQAGDGERMQSCTEMDEALPGVDDPISHMTPHVLGLSGGFRKEGSLAVDVECKGMEEPSTVSGDTVGHASNAVAVGDSTDGSSTNFTSLDIVAAGQDAPSTRRCFSCGGVDHFARDCPKVCVFKSFSSE